MAQADGERYLFSCSLARQPSPTHSEAAAADDAADKESMADYRAGRVVSHTAIMAWVKSWGTDAELLRPEIGD